MKTLTILCLLCATAFAYPAGSDEESIESELFRPLNKKGAPQVPEVDGSESDEDSFFFPSFFRPVFVNPFPQFSMGGFSNVFSGFPSRPLSFRWSDLFNMFEGVPDDANVTNSTSTVKVIDGQRVTVNVTTYEKDGIIMRKEIIQVVRDNTGSEDDDKPVIVSSQETTTRIADSQESSSPKNDNNSLDNEIFREEFIPNNRNYNRGQRPRYQNYNRLPTDYIDLSNDIRVNEIAAADAINAGNFQLPPDVEVFDVPQPNYRYYEPRQDVYEYRYNTPQNWGYNPFVYNNRIPSFFNNVQYYNGPRSNYFQVEPFLPFNSYNYQQRFGNIF